MQVLFVLGMLTWGSLTTWWVVFFHRTYQDQVREQLRAYFAEERLLAATVGATDDLQRFLHALEGTPYTLASLPLTEEILEFPVQPLDGAFTGQAIVLRPEIRERLRTEARRKLVMVAGEGTLLITLLFACLVGLYRMLVSEWRLNQQRERFAHTISHELRSPLAGLRALLQSLRDIDLPKQERDPLVDLGMTEVRRLDGLVENILLSSRLEAGGFEPSIGEVDLTEILRRIHDRKRLLALERGGSLTLDLPDEPQLLRADKQAVETILENLVDNAIKYGSDQPNVVVRVVGHEGRLRVVVEDDGIGLSPDDRERIFERFYRARRGETQVAKGSGLGLFIARRLARACGGDLTADSAGPGKGSRFTLDLAS